MSLKAQRNAARDKLLRAGKIAAKALNYTCQLVKPGERVLAIVTAGEQYIQKQGCQPAFPINISINHHAAHYTPGLSDTRCIPEEGLVKIDLGVHISGFIADNARTVIVGERPQFKQLVEATDAGLQAAIQTVRAGIRIWNISKAISKAIRDRGCRAIENLTGHSITQFNLHSGISIPAVPYTAERLLSPRLKEQMIIAIEPFATYSRTPRVVDLGKGNIYGFAHQKNPQSHPLRRIFSKMKVKFAQLPFASRWMKEIVAVDEIDQVLSELVEEKCIYNYPILGLRDKQVVAQSEKTLIVEKNGCTVTTTMKE